MVLATPVEARVLPRSWQKHLIIFAGSGRWAGAGVLWLGVPKAAPYVGPDSGRQRPGLLRIVFGF